MPPERRRIVLRFAIAFSSTALIFAAVERWFLEVCRWLVFHNVFVRTPPVYGIVSFLFYGFAGFFAGAVVGSFAKSAVRARAWAVFILVAAVETAVVLDLHLAVAPVAVIAAILMIVAGTEMRRPATAERLRWLTNPWTISLLLIGPDWIANDLLVYSRFAMRGAAFAAAVGGVALICRFAFVLLSRVARIAAPATVVITAAVIPLLGSRSPYQLPEPDRRASLREPNVLLVTMDTVRADHVSVYGYRDDTTPGLRRFAQTATTYTRAIAPSNMTLPTHASLFTGLYGSEHRAHFDTEWPTGRPLSRDSVTLAEIFRARGYDVSNVSANFAFLGPEFGLARGFTHIDTRPGESVLASFSRFAAIRPARWPKPQKHLLAYAASHVLCRTLQWFRYTADSAAASDITDRALQRVDHARSDRRPFFLFVNYFDAHEPYLPPPPYDTVFTSESAISPRTANSLKFELRVGNRFQMTPEVRSWVDAQYDGAIASIDASLERLIEGLRRRGLYENTLIVLTSDHGQALGDHGMEGHGTSNFHEQINVPLLIKLPGQRSAGRVEAEINLADIFSFAANRGRKPLLAAQVNVSEAFPLSDIAPSWLRAGRSITKNGQKLMWFRRSNTFELFDLATDPNELTDLSKSRQQTAEGLRHELEGWVQAHPPRVAKDEIERPSEEVQRALRALGYLQ